MFSSAVRCFYQHKRSGPDQGLTNRGKLLPQAVSWSDINAIPDGLSDGAIDKNILDGKRENGASSSKQLE